MLQTVYIYSSLLVCICEEQVQNWDNALFLFKKIKNRSCTYLAICLGQHSRPEVYGSFCQRYTSSSDLDHIVSSQLGKYLKIPKFNHLRNY